MDCSVFSGLGSAGMGDFLGRMGGREELKGLRVLRLGQSSWVGSACIS